MKTKLAKEINPYITADFIQVKIFHQHFSKNFTSGFSTSHQYAKHLNDNT